MARKIRALGAVMLGLTATGVQAADVLFPTTVTPITLTAAPYTQDFNSLAPSSPNTIPPTALPAGWQAFESGRVADNRYQVGSSGSATVGVWSYGTGGLSERALGGRVSPDLPLIYFGSIYQNGLGGTIDSLAIKYTGEQWQNGFNRAKLSFEYSLDATNIINGTWTAFSSLDFLAPDTSPHRGSQFGISATAGNTSAFSTAISGVIDGLAIGAGNTFGVRWAIRDIDTAGVTTDDGLGIDDFSLTATTVAAVPEPASWAMMIGGFGMIGGMMRRRPAASRRLFA